MKRHIKAALLSGLGMPGLGQLTILQRKRRGLVFLAVTVLALLWFMRGLFAMTAELMDQALAGTLAPDPVLIAEKLHGSAYAGTGWALAIIVLCWLASIIDALFVPDRK